MIKGIHIYNNDGGGSFRFVLEDVSIKILDQNQNIVYEAVAGRLLKKGLFDNFYVEFDIPFSYSSDDNRATNPLLRLLIEGNSWDYWSDYPRNHPVAATLEINEDFSNHLNAQNMLCLAFSTTSHKEVTYATQELIKKMSHVYSYEKNKNRDIRYR